MRVYIEVVCKDNLGALIIEGEATKEELQEAKCTLLMEFSQLTGSAQTKAVMNLLRDMYKYKNQAMGFSLALDLIFAGEYKESIDYLRKSGLVADIPNTEEELTTLINKVQGHIKDYARRAQRKIEEYNKLPNDMVTEQYFSEHLVTLTKHMGVKLDKNITLAEYAACIKDYEQHIKIQQHGSIRNK